MASILPNGKTQFVDQNGKPLAGGMVTFYAPGTTTKQDTWQDQAQTQVNTNPVVLDSRGQALIWGSGSYRQVVTDKFGAVIWDQVVSDPVATAVGQVNTQPLFSAAGANARPRTFQDKQRDKMNLLDYDTSTPATGDPSGRFAAAFTELQGEGGGVLEINACNLSFSVAQSVPPGVKIRGKGIGVTNLTYTGAGFAFSTLNANGTQEVLAPQYADFTLTAPSGIQLNSPTGGFTNDASSQAYMMRHEIRDVQLIAAASHSGTGIQYSKCFDGTIHGAKLSGFDVLVDSYGSDICSITGKTSRFTDSSTAAIRIAAMGSFGSQTMLKHIELLALYSGVFIDSSDRMLLLEDVYMEQPAMPGSGSALTAGIYLRGGYTAAIRNLRFEVSAAYCTNWLSVAQDMANIEAFNVTTTGTQYGPALFPAAGSKYWYNVLIRQRIRYGGLTNPTGFPFNSIETIDGAAKNLAILSANTPSITSQNYGASVLVRENSFVLPPIVSAGSLMRFTPGANGTVNIGIIARTDAAGGSQTLNYQLLNGTTVIANGTISITSSTYQYYALASNVSAANLQISLFNQDTTDGGNVFVRKVTVDAV
ncbi:TPA: hypothetical protein QDA99_002798 [Burkholderia vietnamiensis]|nr:hypothetical protein [Burkholderia vietnamiensis]